MKIFISWSGERSKLVADAIKEFLPLVLHYAEPWLSNSDIQPGERWGTEIAKSLEASNYGIICLTKDNLSAPWILFEAGAIAKSMEDGRVIPILLDVDFKEISGPLAQFQAKKLDQESVRAIIEGLNNASGAKVPEKQLGHLFDALWPSFEKRLAEIPKAQAGHRPSRSQGEVLEELVSGFRGLDLRLREVTDEEFKVRRRRRGKPPSLAMRQLDLHGGLRGDATSLVVCATFFKEDYPWVFELGLEAYRSFTLGRHPRHSQVALAAFRNSVEALQGVIIYEENSTDSRFYTEAIHITLDAIRVIEFMQPSRAPSGEPSLGST